MGCTSSKEVDIEEVATKNLQATIKVPDEFRTGTSVSSRPTSRPNSRPSTPTRDAADVQVNLRVSGRDLAARASPSRGPSNLSKGSPSRGPSNLSGGKPGTSRGPSNLSRRSNEAITEGYQTAADRLAAGSESSGTPPRRTNVTPKAFPVDVADYTFGDDESQGEGGGPRTSKQEAPTPQSRSTGDALKKKKTRRGMLVGPKSVRQAVGRTDVTCVCGSRFLVTLEEWRAGHGKIQCLACEALVAVPMTMPQGRESPVPSGRETPTYSAALDAAVAGMERPPVSSMSSAKNIRQEAGLSKVICPCNHAFSVTESEWKKKNGRIHCPACSTALSVPMKFVDGTLSAPSFSASNSKPAEPTPASVYQVEGLTEVTCACGEQFIIKAAEWIARNGKATCRACKAVMSVPMRIAEPEMVPAGSPGPRPVKGVSSRKIDFDVATPHDDHLPDVDTDLVSPREIVQSERSSAVACLCNTVMTVTLDSWNAGRGHVPCNHCGLRLKVPLRKVGKLQEWRYKAVELGMRIPENEQNAAAAAPQPKDPGLGPSSPGGSQVGALPMGAHAGMMGYPGMYPGMMGGAGGFQVAPDATSLRGASRRNQMMAGGGTSLRGGASEASGLMSLEMQAQSRRNMMAGPSNLLQQSMELQMMQQQAMMNNMALGLNPMTGLVNPMMGMGMGNPMMQQQMMQQQMMQQQMMQQQMMQQQMMQQQQQQQMLSSAASQRKVQLGGTSIRHVQAAQPVAGPPPSVTNVQEFFSPDELAPKKMFITNSATHLLCHCTNMLYVTVDSWQECGGVIRCSKCDAEYNLPLRAVGKFTQDMINADTASNAGGSQARIRKQATAGPLLMSQRSSLGSGNGVRASHSPVAAQSPVKPGQLIKTNTIQRRNPNETEVVRQTAAFLGLAERRAKPKKIFMYDTAINVVCGCGQTNLASFEEVRDNNFGVSCAKCACILDIDIPPEKLKPKRPGVIKQASMMLGKDRVKMQVDDGVVEPAKIKQGDKNTKVTCICNATFTVDLSMWLKLPQDQKDYFPCPKCNVRVSVPLRNIGYIPQWRLQTLEQDLPVSFEELK